jgi:hypothetical protein
LKLAEMRDDVVVVDSANDIDTVHKDVVNAVQEKFK